MKFMSANVCRRVTSLLLAGVLTASSLFLASCSSSSNSEENEASGVTVLNMYVITENETGVAAEKAVQKAINEKTVPGNKILVKLNYCTADEYWDKVDEAEKSAVDYAANKKKYKAEEKFDENGNKIKSLSEMNFNEIIDYVFSMDDVELEKPQLDVLVVDTYEKFDELVASHRLAEIDTKYDHKTITKYLHPTLLYATTVNKVVYGIPTNSSIDGKYQFLVYNKSLLDRFGYTVTDLRTLPDMAEYFAKVKASGITPIDVLPPYAGAEIYDGILYSQSSLSNVASSSYPLYMSGTNYMNYLKAVSAYKSAGYVGGAGANSAVRLVESETLLEHEFTENGVTYQAYLYDIPRVTAKQSFKGAMCVSAASLARSEAAELVELFNTDSELANLLQYGVEGEHYKIEDGVLEYIDKDADNTYRMNTFLTGNIYIKHTLPTPEMQNYVEQSMASNLACAPSAFYGFKIDFDDKTSEGEYTTAKIFSQKALEMVENGSMSVDEAFTIASKELNALGCTWDASGTALVGVFGKISTQMSNNVSDISKNFILADEVANYNDVYLTAEEKASKKAKQQEALAEKEAAAIAAAEENDEASSEVTDEDASGEETPQAETADDTLAE